MRLVYWLVAIVLLVPLHGIADENEAGADEDQLVVYPYALYLLPGYEGDPPGAAKRLIEDEYPHFDLLDGTGDPPERPSIVLRTITDVPNDYMAPDMESIGYFGRGLTREQALAVQDSELVVLFLFAYPQSFGAEVFEDAMRIMYRLSRQHDSLIWDEATREIFTADAWKGLRLDTWEDGNPSVEDHTIIHAYLNGDYVRAITLGMEKFGQPDIVVNDFSWSSNRSIGNLINLVAQTLIEGGELNEDLSLDVDVDAIRSRRFGDDLRAALHDNARRRITVNLSPAEPEEGDPYNMLLEIRFNNAEGETRQERQDTLVSNLFGWEDSIVWVEHNKAITAASEAARELLPQLRQDFNDGLEPGEYIQLKAPFETTDGGKEWMWVEVIRWDSGKIKGLLKNEPFHVPDLKAGSEVFIDQAEVFDYIRVFPDGRREGNETGRLIQEFQER